MSAANFGRLLVVYENHLQIEGTTGILANVYASTEHGCVDNATRLAACWNSFDGIPTEDFEGKPVEQYVAEQSFIRNIDTSAGLDFSLNGMACQVLAGAFAGQFIGTGAINFLEVGMSHPDIGPFTVTMQRTEGLTPSALKEVAEKERDEVKKILNARIAAQRDEIGRLHARVAKLNDEAEQQAKRFNDMLAQRDQMLSALSLANGIAERVIQDTNFDESQVSDWRPVVNAALKGGAA